MQFGIHNPSWIYGPDPYEMFDALKRKAQWAENHGFVWFSVMDHLIQILGVGDTAGAVHGGMDGLGRVGGSHGKIRLGTLVSSVAYRNPALLAKMAAGWTSSAGAA